MNSNRHSQNLKSMLLYSYAAQNISQWKYKKREYYEMAG